MERRARRTDMGTMGTWDFKAEGVFKGSIFVTFLMICFLQGRLYIYIIYIYIIYIYILYMYNLG